MSIQIMSQVWQNGPHEPQNLLVMLALADMADEHGFNTPSLHLIAAKSRCNVKMVRHVLGHLGSADFVEIGTREGNLGVNNYRVSINALNSAKGLEVLS